MKTRLGWVLAFFLAVGLVGEAEGQFVYKTNSAGIVITGYRGTNGVVIIPNAINGLPVVEIGAGAFRDNARITNISIPFTVTRVDDNAFYHCTKLVTVTFGDGITRIGSSAFFLCANLRGVYFTGNAPTIGVNIFVGATYTVVFRLSTATGWRTTFGGRPVVLWESQLPFNFVINNGTVTITKYRGSRRNVVIPETINSLPVTRIGNGAFANTPISSVAIPNTITSIGEETFGAGAFSNCVNLTSVVIPDSVTNLGIQAFAFCTALTNVTVGRAVSAIGDEAFADCSQLIKVTLGDNVTGIGDNVFARCINLASIEIPDNVTKLGYGTFINVSR
jgi:hypothetical protein